MSRDVSGQTNITKGRFYGADGTLKRPPSTFRDFIEKGGKFEPEKGAVIGQRVPFFAGYPDG
ncbi:hypothetical protein PM082_008798 [Marasmius tenuissimus]|nr:hypothetical protein PM082_008798 [Marasmius tenuissimus]